MLGLPGGGGEERRAFQIIALAGPAGGPRPALAAVTSPGLCLWRPEPPNSVVEQPQAHGHGKIQVTGVAFSPVGSRR